MWSGWAVTPAGSMVTTTSGCSRSRNWWTPVVRASRSAPSTWPSTKSPNSTRSTPTSAMAARSSASRISGRVSRVAPDPSAISPAWPRVAVQTAPLTPLGTSRANAPPRDQVSSSGWAKIPATVFGPATGTSCCAGRPGGLSERRAAEAEVVQPLDQAQVAVEGLGLWLAPGLQRLQVDADRLLVPAATGGRRLADLRAEPGQQ